MSFVEKIEKFLQIKCKFVIVDGAIMGIEDIKTLSVSDMLYLMTDTGVDKITVVSTSDNWTVVSYQDVEVLEDKDKECETSCTTRLYHTGKTSSVPTYMAREEELHILRQLFNGSDTIVNSKVSSTSGCLLENKTQLIDSNVVVADMSDIDVDTCLEVGFATGINYMLTQIAMCDTIEDVREVEEINPFKYIYTIGTGVTTSPLTSCHTDTFDDAVNILACEYLGKNIIPKRTLEVQLEEVKQPTVKVIETNKN